MDENKMFEFMTKMYSEMQEGFKNLKTEVKSVKEEFKDLKNEVYDITQRLDSIENEVGKLGIGIEGKLIPTSEALLDGYKANAEHIIIIDDKIDKLKIDLNAITMKESYNDSMTIEAS